VLGLLEAEVRDLADGLDDLDLVRAGRGEDDGELGLLDGLRGPALGGRGASRAGDRHRSRLDAPLLLEGLGQLGDVHDREIAEILDTLILRYVCHFPKPFRYLDSPPRARSRAWST